MKKVYVFTALIFLIASVYFIVKPLIPLKKQAVTEVHSVIPPKPDMKLISRAFGNYQIIPIDYTCDGKKISPPFSIEGVPVDTKSLAIIVDDPDAPNGTFTHWTIWNIDPTTKEMREGIEPAMSQEGTTSTGKQGYVPPCPPSGKHRYFFTLYALDTTLGLDGKAQRQEVETAMQGHVIDQFLLIGVYGK